MSRYPNLDAALADGRVGAGTGLPMLTLNRMRRDPAITSMFSSVIDGSNALQAHERWKVMRDRNDHLTDWMRHAAMYVAYPRQPRWHRWLFGRARLVAWGGHKYDRQLGSTEDKADVLARGRFGQRVAAAAYGQAIHSSIYGWSAVQLKYETRIVQDLNAMGDMLDAIE